MNIKKFNKLLRVMIKHHRYNSAIQRHFTTLFLAPMFEVYMIRIYIFGSIFTFL